MSSNISGIQMGESHDVTIHIRGIQMGDSQDDNNYMFLTGWYFESGLCSLQNWEGINLFVINYSVLGSRTAAQI